MMTKLRFPCPNGAEDLHLCPGIGHMILAPQHMGDPEINIVHHAGQRVEIRAVAAHQDRVGEALCIHLDRPQKQIIKLDHFRVEFETPMRRPTFRFKSGYFVRCEAEGCPVVDGWLLAGKLALALFVQLIGRFVTRIETACGFQLFHHFAVAIKAIGLTEQFIMGEAEPGKI